MMKRGIPTVSASGAKIGIARTARPDDDGTTNPRTKKISSITRTNRGPLVPSTRWEEALSRVSEIRPSFITRLIPRARPMIRETATREEDPSEKASTSCFSPRRSLPVIAMNMMIMQIARNEEAMVGNHQPWVMTPQTINTKADTNRMRMILFCQEKTTCLSSDLIAHCALKASRSSQV